MKKRPCKTVRESAVEEEFYEIEPKDLNAHGTLFGGALMYHMFDKVGGNVAKRHSGRVCVTRYVEAGFPAPAYLGETLLFKASLNRVWNTSMEVGVKVFAVNYVTGSRRHIASAYVTFIALDDRKRPTRVPDIIMTHPEQHRRYLEAGERRKFYRRKKKS